jgi:hypothetical protein
MTFTGRTRLEPEAIMLEIDHHPAPPGMFVEFIGHYFTQDNVLVDSDRTFFYSRLIEIMNDRMKDEADETEQVALTIVFETAVVSIQCTLHEASTVIYSLQEASARRILADHRKAIRFSERKS